MRVQHRVRRDQNAIISPQAKEDLLVAAFVAVIVGIVIAATYGFGWVLSSIPM